MSLESILQSIADDEARGQFSGLLEKNPQVKDYLELGERFQPVATRFGEKWSETMERLEALDPAKAAESIVRLPEWVDYHDKNYDAATGTYTREKAAMDEATDLRRQLADARAGKGSEEVDKAALDQYMKDSGFVKRTDLISGDGKGLIETSLNNQAARFEQVYAILTPLATEHAKTFNEPIPMPAVMEHMAKTGERDPMKAYNAVVAPKRQEMDKRDIEARVDAARKEGEAKGRQDAIQAQGGRGVPVSSGGQSGGTSFMRRIFEKRAAQTNAHAGRLGDGSAARDGMADHVKKQMSGGL